MKPAFDSVRQAAAFVVLLAFFLVLPAIVGAIGWGDRRDVYSNIPKDRGPFPWIQSRIYSAKEDIDIAFVGSSQLMFDINPRYVQAKLSETLGHPTDVETIGWAWPGFDSLYYIAHDLLAHRHVHTLVIYDEYRGDGKNHPFTDKPHLSSIYWQRWGEFPEAVAGLPWKSKLSVYAVAVFGTPRLLVTAARGSRAASMEKRADDLFNPISHSGNAVKQSGAARSHLVYFWSGNFTPFAPHPVATAADAVVFSPSAGGPYTFEGPTTPPFQRFYASKVAEICREHGTQLIVIHPPEYLENGLATIPQREDPEKYLGQRVPVVGLPDTKLFAGISPADRKLLFLDNFHLNQNGQDFFTPLITPALIKLYGAPDHHL